MADKENIKLRQENMDETQNPKQEKVHEKAKCTLMILTGAIMVVAVVLVSWCDVTKRSKSCDLKEAVEYLRLNFTVSCKYGNSKENIKEIWEIGISTLVLDFVFLFLSLILFMIPGERQRKGYIACYTVLAIQSFVLVCLLFLRYNSIVDFKATKTETDYGEMKSAMIQSLRDNFTSDVISIKASTSDLWNNFFLKYDCCAVNQVTSTTNDFDTTPWCTTSGSCQQTNSVIPKSCCKAYTIDDYNEAPASCHADVQAGTYRDSCFSRVKMLDDFAITDHQIDVIATITLTLGILKVGEFILAFGIALGVARNCGASCDPTKCYAILGIALTGSNQPPQNVNNCEKYPIFKNCVETQRPSCEGNIMFSMFDEAYTQLTMACVGGVMPSMDSKNCNVTGFGSCLEEAGWQLSNAKKVEYGCDVVSTTMLCVTKFVSGCKNHSLFKISNPAIKQLHAACKAVCKGGCLNGLDFPVENFTDIQRSILCLESELENCPQNKDIQRKIQGLKNLCSDISRKTGMNSFKTCLASSKINQNCKQFLKPSLQKETESNECKRISDYSSCATMALPTCENEEIKEFVSETAKTLASLNSRREGGIQCQSSDGRTYFPDMWILLFTGFLTWMTIFQ